MNDAWKEDAQATIERALHDGLGEEQPFITGWTVIVTFIDDDGEQATGFNSKETDRRTDTFGMLTHALEVQRAALFRDEIREWLHDSD